jgi:Na+-driven multidrug efflux pump
MMERRFITNASPEPDAVIHRVMADIFLAIFVNQFLVNTASLFDTFIVGRFYGDICLSSIGVVYPLLFFLIAIGSVFSVRSQLECSFALSKGDQHRVNSVFTASLCLIGVLSAALTLALLLFPGQTASLLGASAASEELHAVTAAYIRGLAIGVPAQLVSAVLASIMPLDGDRRRIITASLVMVAVNIAGNLLNVHRLQLGMFGIGLMTSLGNYCAAGVFFIHFLKHGNHFHLVRISGLLHWLDVLLRRSLPSIVGQIMKWLYYTAMIRIILSLCTDLELAAYSMFGTIKNIMICVCLGLGSAHLLIAGTMYAENNVRGMRQSFRTGLRYSLVLGLILGGIAAIFAKPILSLSGNNRSLPEAVFLLRLYGVFFCVDFLKFYYSFYVRSLGRNGPALFFNIIGEFILPTGAALLLGLAFGCRGIWAAIPVGSAFSVACTVLWSRIRNGRCRRLMDVLMLLPQSFFDKEELCLNVSPRDAAEGAEYARQVYDYLLKNGYERKTAQAVSLSIEEIIALLPAQQGRRKRTYTNLFVTTEDNCRYFPAERHYFSIYRPDQSADCVIGE